MDIFKYLEVMQQEIFEGDLEKIEEIEGPTLMSFSDIYLENGFDTTDKALGSTLYLIAKKSLCFSKSFRKVKLSSSSMYCFSWPRSNNENKRIKRVEIKIPDITKEELVELVKRVIGCALEYKLIIL